MKYLIYKSVETLEAFCRYSSRLLKSFVKKFAILSYAAYLVLVTFTKHTIVNCLMRLIVSRSVLLLSLLLLALMGRSQVATVEKYVVSYNEVNKFRFINDSMLYAEGWQDLPQAQFWQKIMNLPSDSALLSTAGSRSVLGKVAMADWKKLSDDEHTLLRDSIRKANNIPDSVPVLITIGKRDFYEFKKVIPTISKSIDVFKENGVDPWYAQAILLIESPGKTTVKSGVGANGPFQLMKSVARNQGLIVNKYVDERTDVEKAALGASRLLSRICIPYTKAMLDSAHISYNETDLWFRLLVLHSYHAGAGNVAGVIRKINPCEGGMQLIQNVWQTSYGGFKNASQNYSQLALAAFCNFDQLVMESDSVFLIDGDRMFNNYAKCRCTPYDPCSYLGNCIAEYETDLVDGTIPFDYFIGRVKTVETELSGLTPGAAPFDDDHFNELGSQLLKAKKTDEAERLFKHYEQRYPDSWGVYHGLGDTYRMMGQKQLALKYYRKSLKLNPNNEQSLRAMAQLDGK